MKILHRPVDIMFTPPVQVKLKIGISAVLD